jgi:phage terminase small subunit
LNARRRRFIQEYRVDANATQAAIRAGYSEKAARAQGARLMANADIRAEIEQKQAETAAKVEISIQEVRQIIANGMHFDPLTLVDAAGKPRPLKDMPLATRQHLKKLKVKQLEGEESGTLTEIEWVPVVEHTRDARKHLGFDAPEKINLAIEAELRGALVKLEAALPPEQYKAVLVVLAAEMKSLPPAASDAPGEESDG